MRYNLQEHFICTFKSPVYHGSAISLGLSENQGSDISYFLITKNSFHVADIIAFHSDEIIIIVMSDFDSLTAYFPSVLILVF